MDWLRALLVRKTYYAEHKTFPCIASCSSKSPDFEERFEVTWIKVQLINTA